MDLLQLLETMGYSLSALGSESFPCAITKNNIPIGFLYENLELSFIPGTENNQKIISSTIEFSKENFGRCKIFTNQFLISQYEDYFLTTSFDIKENVPIYHVYQKSTHDFNCEEIANSTSKAEAVEKFTKESRLIQEINPNINKMYIPKTQYESHTVALNSAKKNMEELSPFQRLKEKLQQFKVKLKFLFSSQGLYGELSKDSQSIGIIDNELNIVFSGNLQKDLQKKIVNAVQEVRINSPASKLQVSAHKKKIYNSQNIKKTSIKKEIESMKKDRETVKQISKDKIQMQKPKTKSSKSKR